MSTPQKSTSTSSSTTSSPKNSCLICGDEKFNPQLVQLPCKKHWACRKECFPNFFENAILNQSLHPPKCCKKEILAKEYDLVLSVDLINRYEYKTEEYQTDPRLRRYCAREGCATFLPPDTYIDIGPSKELTIATCRACKAKTCIVCTQPLAGSGEANYAHDCRPAKFEMNKEYSPTSRFKPCPFCGRNGILERACNHIICACNGEWCFICLEPYVSPETHAECKTYGDPDYDTEGYDSKGFHRDSGFDRDGFTRAGYNIRGLNRAGERVTGFATRVVGNGIMTTGYERDWDRAFRRELNNRGVDGLARVVEWFLGTFEGRPDDWEQVHQFVVRWLRDNGIRLQGVNAVLNDTGVPPAL